MDISKGLLLLLSRFSRVQLYATPQMAAHQAPPSLGFSRLENPTGVGCHFPLQCMKVKSESEVAQLCPTPWTAAYQAPPKGLQLFISEKIKANARYLAGTFLVADTMY